MILQKNAFLIPTKGILHSEESMSKTNNSFTLLSRSRSLFLIGLFSIGLLSGCSYLEPYKAPLTQGNVMTKESLSLLQEGLTQSQVRELLGPPMGQNPFNPEHWEYIYYSSETNSQTKNKRSHVVLTFDKDKLLSTWKEEKEAIDINKDDSWLGLGWF